jgi:hypothetical protein
MAAAVFLFAFMVGTAALVRLAVAPAVQPSRGKAARQPIAVATLVPLPATPSPLPGDAPAKAAETPPSVVAPVAPPAATAPAAAPAGPPPPSAKELAFADLNLQSIFYSQHNPSAVISGRRVRPRDQLPAGATVVAISPSSVTLEFENERKVLALK